MPHSGGGGSHSGGHHGGGHHGGSHHGGGSGSGQRISKSYFQGSNRYVYYYRRRPYVYYSTSLDKSSRLSGIFFLFYGLITVGIISIVALLMMEYSDGKPLPMYYDTEIVIQDTIGVIEDETSLRNRLEQFQKKTGITFAIMAVTPETAEFGIDCEIQSYNAYVKNFKDESHWLIYYVGDEVDRSDDWQWNLMCGDDCARILNSTEERNFTTVFHENLLRDVTFDEAVIDAVNQLNPYLNACLVYRNNVTVNGESSGGERVHWFSIIHMGIFVLTGVAAFIAGIVCIISPKKSKGYAKAHAVKTQDATSQLREAKCRYCGGIYYAGTVTGCPHCSAPVELYEEEQFSK